MAEAPIQELSSETVESALSHLGERAGREGALLDWQALQEVQPQAAIMLVPKILAHGAPLEVKVPASPDGDYAVIRSGLAFALHTASATLTGGELVREERWGRSWSPGNQLPWQVMFGEGEHLPENPLFSPDHATLINPHRAPRRNGSDHAAHLIERWARSKAEDEDAADLVGIAVWELLQNVREHAVGRGQPGGIVSLVHAWVTRDDDGGPRFGLSVMDSGPGIVTTLKEKSSEAEALSDEKALARLLAGNLESWGSARGIGLANLCQRAAEAAGELTFITRQLRLQLGPAGSSSSTGADVPGSIISLAI